MHTCTHAYIHACIHTCIHAYIHACMNTYMYVCIHTYIHTCMHACIHTCMHTCIHTHTCIRHTHVHAAHVHAEGHLKKDVQDLSALHGAELSSSNTSALGNLGERWDDTARMLSLGMVSAGWAPAAASSAESRSSLQPFWLGRAVSWSKVLSDAIRLAVKSVLRTSPPSACAVCAIGPACQ